MEFVGGRRENKILLLVVNSLYGVGSFIIQSNPMNELLFSSSSKERRKEGIIYICLCCSSSNRLITMGIVIIILFHYYSLLSLHQNTKAVGLEYCTYLTWIWIWSNSSALSLHNQLCFP